jgi:hypothetical protein
LSADWPPEREAEEQQRLKEELGVRLCPNCGFENTRDRESCSECSVNFAEYAAELEKKKAARDNWTNRAYLRETGLRN